MDSSIPLISNPEEFKHITIVDHGESAEGYISEFIIDGKSYKNIYDGFPTASQRYKSDCDFMRDMDLDLDAWWRVVSRNEYQ